MAASSTPDSLFLAPQRSVLALFQRLVDEGKLTIPNKDKEYNKFDIPFDRKAIPNRGFFHSKILEDAIVLKRTLSVDVQPTGFTSVTGVYVSIQFKTLVIIWYMMVTYDTMKNVDDVINHLQMKDLDLSHIDLLEYFGIPGEAWPLQVEDLFSIILNAFFVTNTAAKSINELLINAKTSIIAEYEQIRECELLVDERCVSYNGTGPYVKDLYGAFVKYYVNSFMFHYGNILSINKGRYI